MKERAKRFVSRIKKQKEEFLGKLFLIKKKQQQQAKKKNQQNQILLIQKKLTNRSERVRQAFQNVEFYKLRTEKRYQELQKVKRNSRNSVDQLSIKFVLPLIKDKSEKHKLNFGLNNQHSKLKIKVDYSFSNPSNNQSVSKSPFYIQDEKKLQFNKKLDRMQLAQKKNAYASNIKKINEQKLNKKSKPTIYNITQTKSQKKFVNVSQNNHAIRHNLHKQLKKYHQKTQENENIKQKQQISQKKLKLNEVLIRSQTAEATIQTKTIQKYGLNKGNKHLQLDEDKKISQIKRKLQVLKNLI